MHYLAVMAHHYTDTYPIAEAAQLAQTVEALGFHSIWLSDGNGRDPFLLASYILSQTTRLNVGTAVVNMYGRPALTCAQIRRDLSELYPGRFSMGLGVSHPVLNDMLDVETIAPMKKQYDYLDGLREKPALLYSPEPEILAPVYAAAHGPKLQEIAAEKADGIMTWAMPPGHIAKARSRLPAGKPINSQVAMILEDDPALARKIAREYIGMWLVLPHYQKAWIDGGFEPADFENGGSDRFIDSLFAWGDVDAIMDKIAEYHRAGATGVILEPLCWAKEPSPHFIPSKNLAPHWDALPLIATRL